MCLKIKRCPASHALTSTESDCDCSTDCSSFLLILTFTYHQEDEILSRNSLMYMSKANLPIAVQ